MAKVITVSRKFPAYHPKAGKPTYFVEKILNYTLDVVELPGFTGCGFWDALIFMNPGIDKNDLEKINDSCDQDISEIKYQTIREGKRWKTGDMASIRIWGNDVNPKTGRIGPYHSKQITIVPDVKVRVFDFEIKEIEISEDIKQTNLFIDGKAYCNPNVLSGELIKLSVNDGLSVVDLLAWFKYPKPFKGQIICWNESVNY